MSTTPARMDSGLGKAKRLSDSTKGDGKKKIFSLFKSSPSTSRRPTISAPSNATHNTHVGIDNETGKLTVSFPRA
jgi:hypothetical protein